MALFNRQKFSVPFDKELVIDQIINAVESTYPDYCIIAKINQENPWDLLIIRSVMRDTKQSLGHFGHERIKQERLQQVFAISVVDPDVPMDKELLSPIGSWTTLHHAVSGADAVLRKLESK